MNKFGSETLAILTIVRTIRWIKKAKESRNLLKGVIEEARKHAKIKLLF